MLDIRNHIRRNFEVEIYIEHIDGVTINDGLEKTKGLELVLSGRQSEDRSRSNNDEDADGFYESEFDFEENNQLFDNFVDASIQILRRKTLG